ncbi:hypothetical protein GCM10009665_19670 [Kitasatospora nipponensis]|uniref:Uncharacterized protein n=1 Tax=Kitasatospora nipponensis TaxID=258049 RepID=A0ABN1W0V5_9ACTN
MVVVRSGGGGWFHAPTPWIQDAGVLMASTVDPVKFRPPGETPTAGEAGSRRNVIVRGRVGIPPGGPGIPLR